MNCSSCSMMGGGNIEFFDENYEKKNKCPSENNHCIYTTQGKLICGVTDEKSEYMKFVVQDTKKYDHSVGVHGFNLH